MRSKFKICATSHHQMTEETSSLSMDMLSADHLTSHPRFLVSSTAPLPPHKSFPRPNITIRDAETHQHFPPLFFIVTDTDALARRPESRYYSYPRPTRSISCFVWLDSSIRKTVVGDGYEDALPEVVLDFEFGAPETDPELDVLTVEMIENDVKEVTPCVDIPPPWSAHDCAIQADYEKCDQNWMRGYCLKSCGKCDDDKKGEMSDHDNPSIIKCPKTCNDKPPSFSVLSCETQVRF